MKILLTGPNGYLAKALIKKTSLDFVYERNAYGDIIETDITQPERFKDMDFDIILHNAGIVGTTNCDACPYTLDVNVNGTLNMIGIALKRNIPLIFFSTTVVYQPTGRIIFEQSKKLPETLYGKTKLVGEHLIKTLLKKYIIIRPCMIFGPNDKHSAITMAMTSTKKSPKIIHLNEEYSKPYLHVDEFARGVEMIINNHERLLGEDINFATPRNRVKVKDILDYIKKLTGNGTYKLISKNDYLKNHYLSGAKIERLVGWKNETYLFDDIKKTYEELKHGLKD